MNMVTPQVGFWIFVIGLAAVEGLLFWLRRHRASTTAGKIAENVSDRQEAIAAEARLQLLKLFDHARASLVAQLNQAPAVAAVPASIAAAATPTAAGSASAGSAAPPGGSGTPSIVLQVSAPDAVAGAHAELDKQAASIEVKRANIAAAQAEVDAAHAKLAQAIATLPVS